MTPSRSHDSTRRRTRWPACQRRCAVDAAPISYQSSVELALAAGATVDEIVGCLIAVAPIIGLARVVSAAPELALALGYDVEAALEGQEEDEQ